MGNKLIKMNKYYIGVDIGGTKCAAVLGEYDGKKLEIKQKLNMHTMTKNGFDDTIKRLFAMVDELINSDRYKTISAIGISCGGPLDSKSGTILSPPNLYGWDNIPIVEMFAKRYKTATYLQNDANAGALAEWKFGAGVGLTHLMFLTCGTGMGAGLILNGELYEGACGLAGEVGHIRLSENGPVGFGKAGSFEGFCSGGGIAQIAKSKVLEKLQMGKPPEFCKDMSALENLSAKSVALAAQNADETANEIYNVFATYLGKALSVFVDILNPQAIIIGSVYARNENLVKDTVEKIMQYECISASVNTCAVMPAKLAEEIGDFASVAVAIYAHEKE